MLPALLASVGAVTGALIAYERRRAVSAERLVAATFETLLNAVDANDADTGAHVRRVAAYALSLANAAGLDDATCRSVERVALFHDIGKIHEALFDIIHDTSTLTPAERQAIRTHPARGADVLEPLAAFYPDLGDGVIAHHERWDGSGYPRGLRGEAIPIVARVVAIVDTFDAVVESRRYRRGGGIARGEEVLAKGRGTEFDPHLVDVFLSQDVRACVERVRRAAQQAPRPRPRRAERRHQSTEPNVPNVRFRWRDALQPG